jgi:hypothetical protein
MPNNVIPIPRRSGRREFLTIGAAAAAVVAGISKARSAPPNTADDAPLFDLIRREDEIRVAGVRLQDQAMMLKRDATAEQLADPVFRAEIEDLKARGAALVGQAGELLDQIDTMIPGTIAGAIALIELSGAQYGNEIIENALAGLREIGAKGGAA